MSDTCGAVKFRYSGDMQIKARREAALSRKQRPAVGCFKQFLLRRNEMPTQITIAAAASLKNVLTDPAFQTALLSAKGVTLAPEPASKYDSSGKLAEDIAAERITPDVFISADADLMPPLFDDEFIDTPDNVVRNNLVLIKNRAQGLPAPIISFGQVNETNTTRIKVYIADYQNYKVPAGMYAQEAFDYFGNWDNDGGAEDIALTTDMATVTVVLNTVAGLNSNYPVTCPTIGAVYFTDAASFSVIGSPNPNPVEIIAVAPSTVNDKIIYAAAALKASQVSTAAQAFVDFVASADAWPFFLKWGFIPLNPI